MARLTDAHVALAGQDSRTYFAGVPNIQGAKKTDEADTCASSKRSCLSVHQLQLTADYFRNMQVNV